MNTLSFLSKLKGLKVKVWVDGERLKIKAPPGVLTPALRAELAEKKQDLLNILVSLKSGETREQAAPVREGKALFGNQVRHWLLERLFPNNPANKAVFAYRLIGEVKLDLLGVCLKEIVNRNESLRSIFPENKGVPSWVVAPTGKLRFKVAKRLNLSEEEREAEYKRQIAEEMATAFDLELEKEALIRCRWIKFTETDHVLVVVAHRIVVDNQAGDQFAAILKNLYTHHVKEGAFPEPGSDTNFTNYWSELDKVQRSERYKEKLDFWKTVLKGKSYNYEFPGNHASPNTHGFKIEKQKFQIPGALASRFVSFSEQHQIPLDALGFGLFAMLVSAYGDQRELIIHAPVDPRERLAVDHVVGPIETFMPVPLKLDPEQTVADVAKTVFDTFAKASENGDVSYEDLVSELQVERNFSNPVLSSFSCRFDDKVKDTLAFPGFQLQRLFLDEEGSPFTFSMRLQHLGGEDLHVIFKYNPVKFSADRIERLKHHFLTMMGHFFDNPDGKLKDLSLLTKQELTLLLKDWNQTSKTYLEPLHLTTLLNKAMETNGDSYVLYREQRHTYQELKKRSDILAGMLVQKQVKPGGLVGVLTGRSHWTIAGYLAILKAGAAIVPFDLHAGDERLEGFVQSSNLDCLLTLSSVGDLSDFGIPVIEIDQDMDDSAAAPLPAPDADEHAVAYVVYTSGSTGKPKGAENTHRGIVNRLLWAQDEFKLGSDDTVLHKSALGFDVSFWEIFWPLMTGANIAIPDVETISDANALAHFMQANQVTLTHFVPSGFEGFADSDKAAECEGLRTIICSGEPLTIEPVEKLKTKLPDVAVYNLYGPAEAAIDVTFHKITSEDKDAVPIGKPIYNTEIFILNEHQKPVPVGVPGEIHISGMGLAKGYHNQPKLTQERFFEVPGLLPDGQVLYKTGDLGQFRTDGGIEFLGRKDHLVKYQGHHLDPREIESLLEEQDGVREALVVPKKAGSAYRLTAYFTTKEGETPQMEVLRTALSKTLPPYMIPHFFIPLADFPMTPSGKISRSDLPDPGEDLSKKNPRASSAVEHELIKAWREVLKIDRVDLHENFFDIGGSPILMSQVYFMLGDEIRQDLDLIDLFNHPTVSGLELHLENKLEERSNAKESERLREALQQEKARIESAEGVNVAIIGMALRVPGADNIAAFWNNIRSGTESISFFSKDELLAEGVDPELLDDPDYVRAMGVINNIKDFDAGFFGFTPREAQLMDPQQRLFLECAWEALELGGYAATNYPGKIGLYGGCGINFYHQDHINANPKLLNTVGTLQILIGNDKDNLCPRIAYKLGLRGPAVVIQTACSTGLVSTHLAANALRNRDCDMALAGGVSLRELNKSGYLYEEGLLFPPDGQARPFDADAQGTVNGQGASMVLLKRYEDALLDGDTIYAVIRASAINNDGSDKAGYTAYSQSAQTDVIQTALRSAGIPAESVSYIETSSTSSPLGDPIEVSAMNDAYQALTDEKHFCALGALKPNIGGTDIAAGAAALIKAALVLHNKEIPPCINHTQPSPKIDFANSPFYVNSDLKQWDSQEVRRVGVNGFGMGGTNAHLVLEEAPPRVFTEKDRPLSLLTLSAPTQSGLEKVTDRLVAYLKKNHNTNLADLAFTLQDGRESFKYRRMLVCNNVHDAVIELEKRDPRRVYTTVCEPRQRPIAFMFPGQGSQYLNMGRQLYQVDPVYKAFVDDCWQIVQNKFPEFYEGLSEQDRQSRTQKIHKTYITQLSLFILEYALAKTLMHWGIQPEAFIANSTGEYTAACLAGVFSLEDALGVVVGRGRLMQTLPPGDMLAVSLSEKEVLPYLGEGLALAGCPSPSLSMVSGSQKAIRDLVARLNDKGVIAKRSFAPHAFHSPAVDSIVPKFSQMLAGVALQEPQQSFISSITGTWITKQEATDPHYWARQQRQTVRFSQGIEVLCQDNDRIFLEVGPEKTLSNAAIQNLAMTRGHTVLATMRAPLEDDTDIHHLLTTVGRLWLGGVAVNWRNFHSHAHRYRLPLPTYPFERETHWIEKTTQRAFSDTDLEPDQLQIVTEPKTDSHFRPNVSNDYVAPRDVTEQLIAGYWREYLGLGDVGIHDDFFELGGSSLVAVRLINQVSKKFGIPLASHVLLQKRTIAALGELIKEKSAKPGSSSGDDSPMIQIQPGNPEVTPIFFVHPIGGEVFFYRDLAHYIGSHTPVYGFRALSLVGEVAPFDDLVKQAAFYAKELLNWPTEIPFILAGSSYGGLVAYEMAQQLIKAGKKVPLLIIVDSPAPGQMPEKFDGSAEIIHYLLGDELGISLDRLQGLDDDEMLSYIFEAARSANRLDLLPDNLGKPMFQTWMAHQTAMYEYKPEKYDSRVLYFRPTEHMKKNPINMYQAWPELVNGIIEIIQVGGSHLTMNFGENAKKIAGHIKRALRSLS